MKILFEGRAESKGVGGFTFRSFDGDPLGTAYGYPDSKSIEMAELEMQFMNMNQMPTRILLQGIMDVVVYKDQEGIVHIPAVSFNLFESLEAGVISDVIINTEFFANYELVKTIYKNINA